MRLPSLIGAAILVLVLAPEALYAQIILSSPDREGFTICRVRLIRGNAETIYYTGVIPRNTEGNWHRAFQQFVQSRYGVGPIANEEYGCMGTFASRAFATRQLQTYDHVGMVKTGWTPGGSTAGGQGSGTGEGGSAGTTAVTRPPTQREIRDAQILAEARRRLEDCRRYRAQGGGSCASRQ
jgi:hypothetical protein